LQEAITAVAYRVTVTGPDDEQIGVDELGAAVDRALAQPALPITRTRKVTRSPRTSGLSCGPWPSRMPTISALSSTRTVHPTAWYPACRGAHAVDGDFVDRRVLRTKQLIERGGARLEPLEADARSRVPEARAS